MDITQFYIKVQSEYGVNPKFNELPVEDEKDIKYITKVELVIPIQLFGDRKDLTWFGIGYNLADANQSCIDKACKFFKWI